MKSRIYFGAALAIIAFVAFKFLASAHAEPSNDTQVKRGEYLVQRVSMCGDCHTPHNEQGELVMTAWLQGNVLDFKPAHPMPFAAVAPGIAGLPTMPTDELALRFLETGTNANGKLPMPPMPRYRFSREDAAAVVTYLRTLKK